MADTATAVKEIFAQMPASRNAAAAKGMNSVIQFNLTGDGAGTYHVVIKDGTCTVGEGRHAAPNMTMTMAAQDYVDLNAGNRKRLRGGRHHVHLERYRTARAARSLGG